MGIVRRDGGSVEQGLLRSLTDFLSYRGPDRSNPWCEGSAGFGHSLLRTGRDESDDPQPASLDGRFWITADARIDCREELADELSAAGRACSIKASDPALILFAYSVWGTDCVQHLLGDFAFAIWDAAQKSLFCARDHFGIKPFYYAEREDAFIFSNTLNCLRLHPSVSDDLNETAIADFLMFGVNYDLATTSFRDIRRLPPAHFLFLSPTGIRVRRYWSPPTNGRTRYAKTAEYVEHFGQIFKAAVTDRLRTEQAGILLSGGLDSGAVAATARELRARQSLSLRAYTVTYNSILPDREGVHAKETADFLSIPIRFFPFDDAQPFDRWNDPCFTRPEPDESPFFAAELDQFHKMAEDCRVVLSGEGSDNLMLFEMWPYLRHLWRERNWSKFLRDGSHYLWVRPFPWRGISHRLKRLLRPSAPSVPSWIAQDLARSAKLEERSREFADSLRAAPHPLLPTAHASLGLPQWSKFLESDDPGATRAAIEVRYPFLDLRIVDFFLSLPPFPYFFEKRLLREAMAGRLPESIRRRRKTPLVGDPVAALLKTSGAAWLERFKWDERISRFIDVSELGPPFRSQNTADNTVNIRAYCLNFWLQSAMGLRYKVVGAEARNG